MSRAVESTARRGAVLLEVVIAVAILLMASITITGAVNQGVRVMERSRMELRAADFARSAMAQIEAGIAVPETLNGPVREEAAPVDETGEASGGFDDSLPPETGWELEIGVSASPFPGLSNVSVRALRRAPGGGEAVEASYTLIQLVRLATRTDDRAGETGELSTESDRGLRERERTGGAGEREGAP